MLKNTKFLYCIIAVLLTVCILCGIHIGEDFSRMYDNRHLLLHRIGVDIYASSEHAKEVLVTFEPGTDSFSSSLAWTKNSLENASQKVDFMLHYWPHTYNIISKNKDFTSYSPDNFSLYSMDFVLSGLVYEAEMMISYYEENGNLAEEHIKWLETLSSSADELINELFFENNEGHLELKEIYYKKDKEFCRKLGEFLNKMESVSLR